MTFSIDPQTMHFFRLFREGGLGLKSTHPSEWTSSYYRIHYSGALRYAYLCCNATRPTGLPPRSELNLMATWFGHLVCRSQGLFPPCVAPL